MGNSGGASSGAGGGGGNSGNAREQRGNSLVSPRLSMSTSKDNLNRENSLSRNSVSFNNAMPSLGSFGSFS